MSRVPAVMLMLSAAIAPLAGESHHAGDLTVEPYSFRTFDGSAHPAEIGHLWVRENRSGGSGGLIQIAFVRLKGTAQKPRAPIVFLPGGPGVPATGMGRVPVYYELFQKLQAISDVILLDQRGIGMSSPNTECPEGPSLAPDVFVKASSFLDALTARVRGCSDYWRAKGVDLATFNTSASADDLEDLRKALGEEKLSLIAHSYGTSIALDAIRRHSEGLERVVLAGVVGPDRTLQMPLAFDFALRRLSGMAANSADAHNAFRDTYHEFQRACAQLESEPLTVSVRDERTKQEFGVKVGAFLLRFAVKDMLSNGRKAGEIPALVYSVARGDPALLTGVAQSLYGGLTSGFSAMQFAVSCSDGSSSERRQLAREQASQSVFGDVPFIHLDPRVCGVSGAGPHSDFSPIWSTVLTMLVSGTLDSNTPVYQAEEVRWGLANGVSLIVENGFHETLPSTDVQAEVTEFFSGANAGRRVLRFAPPKFLTIEEAKTVRRGEH